MTMTAEQLKELLGMVTQGKWHVAGKASGYIVSNSESVVIAVVGDYRDDELLPFNKERWDADCALFALAPSLARRVIAAEALLKSAQALCDRWDTSDWGGSLLNTRHTVEFITELRMDAHAYREASK